MFAHIAFFCSAGTAFVGSLYVFLALGATAGGASWEISPGRLMEQKFYAGWAMALLLVSVLLMSIAKRDFLGLNRLFRNLHMVWLLTALLASLNVVTDTVDMYGSSRAWMTTFWFGTVASSIPFVAITLGFVASRRTQKDDTN